MPQKPCCSIRETLRGIYDIVSNLPNSNTTTVNRRTGGIYASTLLQYLLDDGPNGAQFSRGTFVRP